MNYCTSKFCQKNSKKKQPTSNNLERGKKTSYSAGDR